MKAKFFFAGLIALFPLAALAGNSSAYVITVETVEPQPTLVKHATLPLSELAAWYPKNLPAVYQYAVGKHLKRCTRGSTSTT